jgi:hypothetical protein
MQNAFIRDSVSILLDKVLKSRLQKKAKGVIVASCQYLLLGGFFITEVIRHDFESKVAERAAYTLAIGADVYVVSISVFLFIHAKRNPNRHSVLAEEVEDAYECTNQVPLFDGIAELVLPIKFRGDWWYLPYIAWAWFGAILGGNIWLFTSPFASWGDNGLASSAVMSAALLILFSITSDFSEYWVRSRNQELVKPPNPEETPDAEDPADKDKLTYAEAMFTDNGGGGDDIDLGAD